MTPRPRFLSTIRWFPGDTHYFRRILLLGFFNWLLQVSTFCRLISRSYTIGENIILASERHVNVNAFWACLLGVKISWKNIEKPEVLLWSCFDKSIFGIPSVCVEELGCKWCHLTSVLGDPIRHGSFSQKRVETWMTLGIQSDVI